MNESLYYNQLFGGGHLGNADADSLQKALTIVPATAGVNATAGTIDTRKPEFMSAIVTSLLPKLEDIKFTKSLFTDYTPNSLYQARRNVTVGTTSIYGTHSDQISLNELAYPSWDRKTLALKLHTDSKAASMLAQSERYYENEVDLLEELTNQAVLSMLIRENRVFYKGSARLDSTCPSGVFDLHQQNYADSTYLTPAAYAAKDQVIDLRGSKLSYDYLNHADTILMQNFDTNVNRALWIPQVSMDGITSTDIGVSTVYQNINETGKSGLHINKAVGSITTTNMNLVKFNFDLFIGRDLPRLINDTTETILSTAPAMPNVTSGTNAEVTDTGSAGFITTGVVYYGVAAVGKTGISRVALINATPVTISATTGKSVDLVFTSGAGTYAEEGYIIYRTKTFSTAQASTANLPFYPILQVTLADLSTGYDGGTAVIRDRNRVIAGLEDGLMISMVGDTLDPQVIRRVEMRSNLLNGITRFQVPYAVSAPLVQMKLTHAYGLYVGAPSKIIVLRNILPR